MAGEIQLSYASSKSVYAVIRNKTASIWNVSGAGAFVNYDNTVYASFVIQLSEQGASGYYAGTFPTAISAGIYSIVAKEQIGGSPSQADPTIAVGDLQWNGASVFPLSDIPASGVALQRGEIRIGRGQMLPNFMFKLVSSLDHITPFTSGVVSGQIARDNGSFGALQSGVFTEVGLGVYRTTLTSGDMLGNTIALSFSASHISGLGTADQRDFSIVTQKTSGAA